MVGENSIDDSTVALDGFAVEWELATFAAERIQHIAAPTETDQEKGERRFGCWRRMAPFRGTPQEVETRLSPFGVNATELTALLGESPESLRTRLGDEPSWSHAFTAAWRKRQPGLGDIARQPAGQGGLPESLGFLEISRPLLAEARARLLVDLGGLAESITAIPELAPLPTILADSLPLAHGPGKVV
jgi:hypothetical protein